MPDNLSLDKRSKVMASIRGKDTQPEMLIRRNLWRLGVRYRVNDPSVLGVPDVSSKHAKVAVFIDGCFWHGCSKCYREPTSNVAFWRSKLAYNKRRRGIVNRALRAGGWTVLQYWEHEVLSNPLPIAKEIARHL
jgi:DNA mismatch endonuclease (patch repair protein)